MGSAVQVRVLAWRMEFPYLRLCHHGYRDAPKSFCSGRDEEGRWSRSPKRGCRPSTVAIVGMLAGYAVWLGGATIIAVMTPVQLWTLAGALLLVTLIVVAFVSGRHAPEHDV
jgi:hypothetical protein